MRRNHISTLCSKLQATRQAEAGALLCCGYPAARQGGSFTSANSRMAEAAQVPKHDWSLPTRPGLEIEDVSLSESAKINFFCSSACCFSLIGGNCREHLLCSSATGRVVFKLLDCTAHDPAIVQRFTLKECWRRRVLDFAKHFVNCIFVGQIQSLNFYRSCGESSKSDEK